MTDTGQATTTESEGVKSSFCTPRLDQGHVPAVETPAPVSEPTTEPVTEPQPEVPPTA